MIKMTNFEYFEKFIFHLILLEINKLCSLKPDEIRLGKFSKYFNKNIEEYWYILFKNIWGQWRYEN